MLVCCFLQLTPVLTGVFLLTQKTCSMPGTQSRKHSGQVLFSSFYSLPGQQSLWCSVLASPWSHCQTLFPTVDCVQLAPSFICVSFFLFSFPFVLYLLDKFWLVKKRHLSVPATVECEEKDTGVGAGVLSETKTRQENPKDCQFQVIPQDHSKALAKKKTWESRLGGTSLYS